MHYDLYLVAITDTHPLFQKIQIIQMVAKTRTTQENLEFMIESLDALRIGVDAYQDGNNAAWMIVSARLYQLLIDCSNSNTPVALRTLTNLELHPLIDNYRNSDLELIVAGGGIRLSPNSLEFVCPFDLASRRIPLSRWLEQVPMVHDRTYITLKNLIRYSRNTLGGGHFDDKVSNSIARNIESGIVTRLAGRVKPGFQGYIVAIGEYIHKQLTLQLALSIGNGHIRKKNWDDATEMLHGSLSFAKEQNDLQGQSEALHQLGAVALESGDYPLAIEHYTNAQHLNLELGWSTAIYEAGRMLSFSHYRLAVELNESDSDLAMHNYREAIAHGSNGRDPKMLSAAFINLGIHYNRRREYQHAIVCELIPIALGYLRELVDVTSVVGVIEKAILGCGYSEKNLEELLLETDDQVVRSILGDQIYVTVPKPSVFVDVIDRYFIAASIISCG